MTVRAIVTSPLALVPAGIQESLMGAETTLRQVRAALERGEPRRRVANYTTELRRYLRQIDSAV